MGLSDDSFDVVRAEPSLPGRLGMYNDNNSDHFADMGRFIAENLVAGKEIWDALEEGVKDYKIVY